MANQLKMTMVNGILALEQRGQSQPRIAREFGIDGETVARYVRLREADSKPATKAPIGSVDQDSPKSGPERQCAPCGKTIEDELKEGLSVRSGRCQGHQERGVWAVGSTLGFFLYRKLNG